MKPTLAKVYGVIAAALVAWWLAAAFGGWELGGAARDRVPDEVRAQEGGYRTFHYWHGGYHGGK
jgi:hypothetical protein